MKPYFYVISLSMALTLIPLQNALAITHARPAETHTEAHSEDAHHEETPTHEVDTTTHKVTTTTHTITRTTEKSDRKQKASDKISDKTSDKASDKVVDKDSEKKPLKASTADISKSVSTIFKKEGNPSSLDKKQIYQLSKDTNITGQEAATLAAMVLAISNAKHPDKITFTEAQLLAAFKNPNSALYYYYNLALSNLNGIRKLPESEKLWGPGVTYKTQIIQNSDGDCYFLSAINSLLQTKGGPAAIEKMIKPVPGKDDEFTVKFPGDPTDETVKLTATEIGMYSHLSAGGKWLAILSVAEAMRRDRLHLNPEITMDGGYQTQTYGLMTDKKYKLYNIPTKSSTKSTEWTVNTITSALNDNLPIGLETSDHDLSIIGYENGMVIVKNPWGTSGWYNPTNGDSSSSIKQPSSAGPWYYMSEGVFSVPVGNIGDGFTQIAYAPSEKSNPSASFTPQLPVPPVTGLASSIPAISVTPGVVREIAPVNYVSTETVIPVASTSTSTTTPVTTTATENEESAKEEKRSSVRCNYDGKDPRGCVGN